jgi:hypothetical protein
MAAMWTFFALPPAFKLNKFWPASGSGLLPVTAPLFYAYSATPDEIAPCVGGEILIETEARPARSRRTAMGRGAGSAFRNATTGSTTAPTSMASWSAFRADTAPARASQPVPTPRKAREHTLQLVWREVHMLDDAAIELRGGNVAPVAFESDLAHFPEDNALDTREPITRIGHALRDRSCLKSTGARPAVLIAV